jgi:RimJ/RimL family protein N-acetyltransferase
MPEVPDVPGETSDGVVTLRAPGAGDAAVLVAGRDEESRRWLGPGDPAPAPTWCIVVDGGIVGWVDWDTDRTWLEPGQVNVGYGVFAVHRGQGYATRAVHLLLHRLALAGTHHTATLLIDRGNARSLALAARVGFTRLDDLDDNVYFARPVPPLTYTDGTVALRRQSVDDVDADLEAKDDEQINWLWLPGQREQWEALSAGERRARAAAGLQANRDAFGRGPKWIFAVDAVDAAGAVEAPYVVYVDADLANDDVPRGEANISYSSHPAHRGRGHVTRAVRLLVRFLADHTGARQAHVIVDARNGASLRVAIGLGARPAERWVDAEGHTMIRHVVPITRSTG